MKLSLEIKNHENGATSLSVFMPILPLVLVTSGTEAEQVISWLYIWYILQQYKEPIIDKKSVLY